MKGRYIYCGACNFKGAIRGLKSFRMDADNGAVCNNGVFGMRGGQSIIAVLGNKIISVCEVEAGGAIVSYAIRNDGSLGELDALEVSSTKLSYLCADPVGSYVYVSSMGNATVMMIRVEDDGKLVITDEHYLTGHSVTARQSTAKVHSCMASPDGRLVAAANLGADEVTLFGVDRKNEKLRFLSSASVDAGRGPRHLAFHPSGKYLYLVCEMGNRVYGFLVRENSLYELAAYSTLDPNGVQEGWAADIVVSPDGKFVYASNRGQHNIAVWAVDEKTGYLKLVGHYQCGGAGPRGIHISEDGGSFFSANCDDGTVTVLARDAYTGAIGNVLQILDVPYAGCVRTV